MRNIKTKLSLAILIFLSVSCATKKSYFVDPFIGTAGSGHTYPGATTPFGMVQLSPDLGTEGWELCSGYHESKSTIFGFSHTHLNGTGGSDLGDILLMPSTFSVRADTSPKFTFRSSFRHHSEKAGPGYYSVFLDKPGIKVELTASTRVGFHKYTMPATDTFNLLIDLYHNIFDYQVFQSEITAIDSVTLLGSKIISGWPGQRNVYYAIKFSQPVQTLAVKNGWEEPTATLKHRATAILDKNIKIDGNLNEKTWEHLYPVTKMTLGTTSNKAWFGVAWDSKNLYLAVKAIDSTSFTNLNLPWVNDAVEVFVDGDNNKAGKYDEHDTQIGITFGKDEVTEGSGVKANVIQKSRKTADGYVLEAALEWESIGVKPEEGIIIGLDVAVNDNQKGSGRESVLRWSGRDNNWISTAKFGEIKLSKTQETAWENESEISKPFNVNDFKLTHFPVSYTKENGIVAVAGFNNKKIEELLVKVGISTTSKEAALKAIENEIPLWNFEATRKQALDLWDLEFSKIDIEAPDAVKTVFYTGLYHALVQPNIISDADGKYMAPDHKVHTGKDNVFYSTFSLWDTYRAANPLYIITQQDKVPGMINSLIDGFPFTGYLPRWQLWGGETNTMIGNHAISVIAEAYLKGVGGFDIEKAYEAMKATSTTVHTASNWPVLDKYGYLPYDIEKQESVSRTLELCYNDWCVAQVARKLNKLDDYNFFLKRSGFYGNVFDTATNFMRGKDSKGQWVVPFMPLEVTHIDAGSGCYTEGNAWQHTWYVPHDVKNLIKLMGGQKAFEMKLDTLFSLNAPVTGRISLDVTGLIGQYAHGNEPSHHVAYLYNYAGTPWKTQEIVRKIMLTLYNTSTNGLCGNDDCGQMSAWYIFSALGFYPVNPASGLYDIGSPLVHKAVLKVGDQKKFTVIAENNSAENIYVKALYLNGKELHQPFLKHEDIIKGGELKFVMSGKPEKTWFKE